MWLTRCILGDGVSEDFLIDQAADGGAGQGEEDDGGVSQLGLVMKSSKAWQVEELQTR